MYSLDISLSKLREPTAAQARIPVSQEERTQ